MRLITSHIGSDFDSFASMVAASKLYEGAVMCFSGSASRNVREFVKRYQTRWKILTPRKIDLDEVTSLIVVDTRSRSRIGSFTTLLGRHDIEVHVYDHHPSSSDDIAADYMVIEPVGATTTLLVEIILEKGIPVSSHEATLFAMGIYEDTGGLTFGATCSRDFEMLSRMKELGADLTMIPSHVEMSLNASERRILDLLIENAWQRYINGARVVLSYTVSSTYIEGLSLFVHRMRDYFDADVAIASVKMDNRNYVVARSREEVLDVAAFLEPLGGGGHPQAASATLTNRRPLSILKELEKELEKQIKPSITVADVMTSPVMAVDPRTSIDDAYRAMIRYGHSALPVIMEGDPVGIITRKDLDKARLHGFGLAFVEEFMTEGIITIPIKASVAEAHHILVVHNIGRIPVMEGKNIVGIVTRTDLLRALYPASLPPEDRLLTKELPWMEDLGEYMHQILPSWLEILLYKLGSRAAELGTKAYVVGGFVRDLILKRPNLDLDVVIEGDAISFIKSWEKDACHVAIHSKYKTGTIVFPDGKKVDIATARREFYEYPVAQPQVSSDSLKHDLYRRDFTINAMAISINSSNWGQLIDYFGGRRDLQRKTLKVLHNLSFVEDPTRIIRGIRLEQRLGFKIEDNSLRLLNSCVKGGLLSLLSGFRLRSELQLSFMEKRPHTFLHRMEDLGVWEILFPGIKIGKISLKVFRRLSAFLKRISNDLPFFDGKEWLVFLCAMVMESTDTVQFSVEDRLHLSPGERRIVNSALSGLGAAEQELGYRTPVANSLIYMYLWESDFITCLFWAAATNRSRVRRRIILYLTRLHRVEPMLTGRDLLDLGFREGPLIGDIIFDLKLARLDGELETREEEMDWIRNKYTETKGE